MKEQNSHQNMQGLCPVCCHKMVQYVPENNDVKLAGHRYYCCENAQPQHSTHDHNTHEQNYYEEYICPICEGHLEQITGCGAVNYLCQKDGLISSSKIRFYYRPLNSE